jgi:hypothetical protein
MVVAMNAEVESTVCSLHVGATSYFNVGGTQKNYQVLCLKSSSEAL